MKQVIAVVGAGGKTTYIKRRAEWERALGKRVLVVTTTHMAYEEGMDVSCDPNSILGKLDRDGYCVAGRMVSEEIRKIGALPEEIYTRIAEHADIILCEADGARHMRAKYPNANEPVIPSDATEVVIIMGLDVIGMPIRDAVHRYQLLGLPGETIVDKVLLRYIAMEVYSAKIGDLPYTVYFTRQTADGLEYEKIGGSPE